MSDQNTDIINHLRAELAEARKDAGKYRHALKKTKGEFEAFRASSQGEAEKLQTKQAELKKALDAKPDPESELAQLKQQLRERDHKDAFKALYQDTDLGLNDKVDVKDLWSLLGYAPSSDAPDLEAIKTQLGELRESKPYLFQAQVANDQSPGGTPTRPPVAPAATPGPGHRRGAPDATQGFFSVRRSDTQDLAWMQANQAKFAAAQAEGRVRWTD